MYDDRAYLAAFCGALPHLGEIMRRQGRTPELDAAVRSVRSGTPVLEVLAALGIPPHVLTGPGIQRGEDPGSVVRGMPRHATGESYRCPVQRCGLEAVREPGGPLPAGGRCWLHGEPLLVSEA